MAKSRSAINRIEGFNCLSKNCFGTSLRTELGYVDRFTAKDLADVDIKNIIPLIVDILTYENSKKISIKYRLEKKSD